MKAPEGAMRQQGREGCGRSPRLPGLITVVALVLSKTEEPHRIFGHIAWQEQSDWVPEMETANWPLRGRMIIRRRTIRTPGALGLKQAAAGRVTVLSRQYTYPIKAFMG